MDFIFYLLFYFILFFKYIWKKNYISAFFLLLILVLKLKILKIC